MPSGRRVANVIAVRRFRVVGEPEREIVLNIGKPRKVTRPGPEWRCTVLIEGMPTERRFRVFGADAVHALQLALEAARHEIDASGLAVTWLDEGEPGDLGLPLSAPIGYGLYFQQRVERSMQRQTREMAAVLSAVLQERARRRANRGIPKG
jgi:hypothetical protein